MKTGKEAGETEEGKDAGKTNGQWSVRELPEKLCYAGFYLFLLAFVVLYVFYAPEGYIHIATKKYRFFKEMARITGAVMIPLIILRHLPAQREKGREKKRPYVSATDIFVLLFLVINVISFSLSKYKEEAIWGTSGWYMGFAMMLAFTGIYFLASRFYDRRIDLFVPFMRITAVVFLWGLLNRFSVYPVDMQYNSESFISCIGNINWFCGYWSVFFPIGTVLYIVAEKRFLRIVAAVYSILSLATGVVQGSDSAYISIGVVFFSLFLTAFQKTEYMKRWLEECAFFCGACQIMRIIAALGPEKIDPESTGWAGLNLVNPMIKFMLGNVTLVLLVFFILLRVLLEREDKKFMKNRTAEESLPRVQWIQNIAWLKYTAIGLTVLAAAAYLILLIINTRTPGILGPLSRFRIFLFDGSWGSNRGATWRDGLLIYRTFSLKERLFGAGQDCFSFYAYSEPELAARFAEEWPSSRLTNAHNECITFLVNLGIFGMLSFIGIFASSCKRLFEKAKEEPLCYVFAASLLSYFFHNQFSFSQVMNIPYIFLMLGLGENLMRKDMDF